jgi:cytochrome c-type biogenesis protein CcmH
MRTISYLAVGLVVFLLMIIPSTGGIAQEPTPSDDEVNAIAKQLYCPTCDNVPLDICPTVACDQWRGIIRDKLALGLNEDQIKQYFVDQYGDRVLATPPARGLNWLVYVLPPLAFIVGGVILFSAFRSWTKENVVDESSTPAVESEDAHDPYVARLEEELRRRR